MPSLANPLWQFSLAVYADPAVRAECLRLQDVHRVNINLLLAVAWLGAVRSRALTPAEQAQLRAAITAIDIEVVQPLRQARRQAKAHGEAQLSAAIGEIELQAEKIVQDRLYEMAKAWSGAIAAPSILHRNISLLLAEHNVAEDDFPRALAAAAHIYTAAQQ
mgnify:CR=1 FL=1